MYVWEKMKIGLFKLEQRNLEFDVRDAQQQKELSTSPSVVDIGYIDMPDKDNMFDSLSKGIERQSTVVTQSVDNRSSGYRQAPNPRVRLAQSVDKPCLLYTSPSPRDS